MQESIAKEKEDTTKEPVQVNEGDMEDDIPLFYSDIMPLLVSRLKKLVTPDDPSGGTFCYTNYIVQNVISKDLLCAVECFQIEAWCSRSTKSQASEKMHTYGLGR